MFDLIEEVDKLNERRRLMKEAREIKKASGTKYVPDLKNFSLREQQKIIELQIKEKNLEIQLLKIREELAKFERKRLQ